MMYEFSFARSLCVTFVALYTISLTTLACGGSSGAGGVSVRYQLNPWFLQNTKDISYCINIDTDVFSASASLVDKSFRNAFSYWQRSFSYAAHDQNETLKLATQTLTRVSCGTHTNPDIYLQLGFLREEQQSYVPTTHNYVALAQITDYDHMIMQGKGFIFVIADDENSLMPRQWSKAEGHVLTMTLIHELGHIFGLRHDSGFPVMKDTFPDEMFSLDSENLSELHNLKRIHALEDPFKKAHKQPLVLDLSSQQDNANFEIFKTIFHQNSIDKFTIEFHKRTGHSELRFFSSSFDGTSYYYLDRAAAVSFIPQKYGSIRIRIPKNRNVFATLPEDRIQNQFYHGYNYVLEESYVFNLPTHKENIIFIGDYYSPTNTLSLQMIEGEKNIFLGHSQ